MCNWTCPADGPEPPRARCPKQPPPPGLPSEPRTEAEQAALMIICRTNACGHHNGPLDECRSCGCTSERRARWLSRLRIGTCPHWPAAIGDSAAT